MRYFIGLLCIMCLLVVSRLCIDTHSTPVAEDMRFCILLSCILYSVLEVFNIFRILRQWTNLYFTILTFCRMYDNPDHCIILALIRHHGPRISISIPI